VETVANILDTSGLHDAQPKGSKHWRQCSKARPNCTKH